MVTSSDAEVAVEAAQAGAAVVRARFGAPLHRVAKEAGDFATAADIDAEQAIGEVLHAERPADAMLGEEQGLRGEGDRTWLVDPLCGTLNFAAGMMVVAVNVALRAGTEVTAAFKRFATEYTKASFLLYVWRHCLPSSVALTCDALR